GHGDARHRQQEAWIDTLIARLDAFAAEHAGLRPFARGFGAIPVAHDVDDAGDDVFGRRIRDARRLHARTDLDAPAAPRAGVKHLLDACFEGGFEGDVVRL